MTSIWILTGNPSGMPDQPPGDEVLGTWLDTGDQFGANAAQDYFEAVYWTVSSNEEDRVRGDDGTDFVSSGNAWLRLNVFAVNWTREGAEVDEYAGLRSQTG